MSVLMHTTYYTSRLNSLIRQIEDRFPAASREMACMETVLATAPTVIDKSALLALIAAPDGEDAARLLSVTRDITWHSATNNIRDALNASSLAQGDFRDFIESKGYTFIDETGRWYTPRKEYKDDKYNLREIVKAIPADYQSLYRAAFLDFLRSAEKRNGGPHRLSYTELCYTAGLLLETHAARREYLGLVAGSQTAFNSRKVRTAYEFIADYCKAHGTAMPDYDIGLYITDRPKPPPIRPSGVRPADVRPAGPQLPKLSFQQKPLAEEEASPRHSPMNGYAIRKNASNGHARPVGRDGFNLDGALSFIKAARRSGDLKTSDRAVSAFAMVAADNDKTPKDVARELDMTPVMVTMMYVSLTKELKKAGFEPPAFQ